MNAVVAAASPEPPRAWHDRMLVAYPNGGKVAFDPCGRFYRPGDFLNGYVVDRFELDGERVVAILRVH
jgi:hypothetical protein